MFFVCCFPKKTLCAGILNRYFKHKAHLGVSAFSQEFRMKSGLILV